MLLVFFGLVINGMAQSYNYFGYRYMVHATTYIGSNYPFYPHNAILQPSWRAGGGVGKMFSEKFILELNGAYCGNDYTTNGDLSPMKGIALAMNFKFFRHKRKGAVAPVGRYFALEISYNNLQEKYEKELNIGTDKDKIMVKSIRASAMLFSFQVGKNIVVRERILLGIGTRLTIFPPAIFGSDHPTAIYLEKNFKNRLWVSNLLQGIFTAGYLF